MGAKLLTARHGSGRRGLALTALPWLLLAYFCAIRYLNSGSIAAQEQAHKCPLQLAAAVVAAVAAPAGDGLQQPDEQQQLANQPPPAPPPLNLTYIEQLLSQPSPLHGLQQKGGLPNRWPLLLDHMTNRDPSRHGLPQGMTPAVYDWFARAHTFNRSAGHSHADVHAPVPACHFWVDHKYKVVMVRNTKTAGTSVAAALGMKENPVICQLNRAWCYSKCVGRQLCLRYLWDRDEVRKAFKEYTVFTFVRNPYARAVSSWMHINKQGITKRPCQRSFASFAELPGGYGAMCMADPDCCMQRFGWVLEHTEPQAPCIFDCDGAPSVDFIGRVEHIEEDMLALVDLINKRRPMGVEVLQPVELERLMVGDASLAGDDHRREAYAQLYLDSPAALDDIRSYYSQDFKQLRFPDSPDSLQAALAAAADDSRQSSSSSSESSEGEEEREASIAELVEAAAGGANRAAAVDLVKAAVRLASRRAGGGITAAAAAQ